MKPGEVAVPATLLLVGGYLAVTAGTTLQLTSPVGPGPGLMPLIVGLALAGFSLAGLLIQVLRPGAVTPITTVPVDDDDEASESTPMTRWGTFRIAIIVAAQVAFIVLFEIIGFAIAVFAFLLFVVKFVGRTRWWVALVLAAALAAAYIVLFEVLLGIPFPTFFGLF